MYSLKDIREYMTAGDATHAPTEASKAEKDVRNEGSAAFLKGSDLNAFPEATRSTSSKRCRKGQPGHMMAKQL